MIIPIGKNRGLKRLYIAFYFSEINRKALYLIAFKDLRLKGGGKEGIEWVKETLIRLSEARISGYSVRAFARLS